MNIAVIDNYDSFVFNLVRYLEESIGQTVQVFRNDSIDFKALEKVDGIVLSPGPGIPKEAGELLTTINRFHREKPLFGVCLGHQAIAEFFGGKLIQESNPMHGKSSTISHENDQLFYEVPRHFQVGRYHSWTVDSHLPKELISTAKTMDNSIMAIRHKELNIQGVQFHPESILTPHGRKIIQNWIASIN